MGPHASWRARDATAVIVAPRRIVRLLRLELRLAAAEDRIVRASLRVPQSMIADVIEKMSERARLAWGRSLEGFASAIGANEVAPHMLFEGAPAGRRHRSRPHVTP